MSLRDDLINDLNEIFDESEFAIEVSLPDDKKIVGIFDDEYRGINLQGGDISTTAPQVLCKEFDAGHISLGTTLTINSKNYTVIERQPDGTGLITLILIEASATSPGEEGEDNKEDPEDDE